MLKIKEALVSMFETVRFVLLMVAVSLLVAGCSYLSDFIEPARLYAGKGAAEALIGECGLSNAQRLQNLNSVNVALQEAGSDIRALAVDCDGDGQPDVLSVQ